MADDTIVPFTRTGVVGDGIVIDPDRVLENAKGNYRQVVVVGFDQNGQIDLRSSHGSRDTLWILQRAIFHLMFETD